MCSCIPSIKHTPTPPVCPCHPPALAFAAAGVDFVCVQSYDGQVSFFEAESAAFSRYLPNFLVPGPLAYVEASDTFITANAALELEAYKYKVLAAASPDKQQQPSQGGCGAPGPGVARGGGGEASATGGAWLGWGVRV